MYRKWNALAAAFTGVQNGAARARALFQNRAWKEKGVTA